MIVLRQARDHSFNRLRTALLGKRLNIPLPLWEGLGEGDRGFPEISYDVNEVFIHPHL